VEALRSDMAQMFPLFSAGDLVISLKHINTVAVMDQSGHIKWIDSHHFNREHDVNFENTGLITVFDNREDGTDAGEFLGGSAIRSINPNTHETAYIYPTSRDQFFFTNAGGKHQLFASGSRLITEVRAGRVFEIDSNGKLLWEWYQQPYNDTLVPEVMEGRRYMLTEAEIAQWKCSK